MSEQSTRAVGSAPFEPEDYAFTARLLRAHCNAATPVMFRAVCSNNLNIILAALDAAEAAPTLLLALETLLQWFRPSEDTDDADDPAVAAARQAHAAVKLARGDA